MVEGVSLGTGALQLAGGVDGQGIVEAEVECFLPRGGLPACPLDGEDGFARSGTAADVGPLPLTQEIEQPGISKQARWELK